MTQRVDGYDVARAMAIFGMVFVNFKLVLGSATGSPILYNAVTLLEGRASALFVVLAGVGISLLTRSSDDIVFFSQKRVALFKRGALLVFLGLLFTPIWPADILHFYGFYFLLAAFFIHLAEKIYKIKLCDEKY